jgi:hypothetical protein
MNALFEQANKTTNTQSARVKDLSFAGQMSIWGVRLLATSYREEMDVTKTLIEGFKKCNAMRAGSNLLFLMEIVFTGLSRDLHINCACNPDLTEDELKLLELFSISQHFSDSLGNMELLDFLTAAATDNAIPIFDGYGDAMRDAGLLLPVCGKMHVEPMSITELMKPSSMSH